MFARVLAIGLMLSSSVPTRAEPIRPTAKWVVNFDEQQCLAIRDYGTPSDPLKLILKQPALGAVMQVAVQAEGGATKVPVQLAGSIQFDAEPARKMSALQFVPRNSPLAARMINMPLADFNAIRTARNMVFAAGKLKREFALSDVPDLLKVMDHCIADLRRVWNVPLDLEGKVKSAETERGPTANLSGLIKSSDYPLDAIQGMESGTVRAVLLVNEAGKVADCSLVETSGVAVLDAQTCAILAERARFTPAAGADGKPRKSAFIQQITWRLAGVPPRRRR